MVDDSMHIAIVDNAIIDGISADCVQYSVSVGVSARFPVHEAARFSGHSGARRMRNPNAPMHGRCLLERKRKTRVKYVRAVSNPPGRCPRLGKQWRAIYREEPHRKSLQRILLSTVRFNPQWRTLQYP